MADWLHLMTLLSYLVAYLVNSCKRFVHIIIMQFKGGRGRGDVRKGPPNQLSQSSEIGRGNKSLPLLVPGECNSLQLLISLHFYFFLYSV